MRMTISRRVFSVLSSLWLVLLLAEPPGIHACPVHSVGSASHALSHHGAAKAHGRNDNHKSAKCTCLDVSCHAAQVAVKRIHEIAFADAPIKAEAAFSRATTVRPASPAPFSLPYANGPPSAVVV